MIYLSFQIEITVQKKFITLLTFLSFFFLGLSQGSGQSIARKWNNVLLDAIRTDFARPTVHARNLYHLSMAHYDAFAAFDPSLETYFLGKTVHNWTTPYEGINIPSDIDSARHTAISFASYRLLFHRFQNSPGFGGVINEMDSLMNSHNYDFTNTSVDYINGGPAELGNYIASEIIAYGLQDGSNEANGYQNTHYQEANPSILVEEPGNPDIIDPNRWQPITLTNSIDQAGNPVQSTPPHLSPEWGDVHPFSLHDSLITVFTRSGNDYNVFMDPGEPAYIDTTDTLGLASLYKWNFCMVSIWQSHLDPNDTVMWDISPASRGNLSSYPQTKEDHPNFYEFIEGGVQQPSGYAENPVTNQPYAPQLVPRADYTRVLAEFWADGIDSETPPGHWFEILHTVLDHPLFEKKWMGSGNTLSDLEYDVRAHFILGGAMHDAAVTAWSVKGWYDYLRPVSAIRYMAELGQCSDTNLINFHPGGIPLIPNYIELVEVGDSLEGSSQENVGKIKLYTWRGPDYISDPTTDYAGVGWILAENWWPYQRPTFVTPPFAGYMSGHSTFSRAAAEVLTFMTGDPYFPGGMSEFYAEQDNFLHFEKGPSVDVTLQWAKYRDASDECSLSRIWGGIHPPVDDIPGRLIGEKIGEYAFDHGNAVIESSRPAITDFLGSDSILNSSLINSTIDFEITYDATMDTSFHPKIDFLADDPLANCISMNTQYWEDSSTFKLSFELNNYSDEQRNIIVQIDSAISGNGRYQAPHLYTNPFVIDTRLPLLNNAVASDSLINNQIVDSLFYLDILIDEACDTLISPVLTFINPATLGNTLILNNANSYWIDNTTYRTAHELVDNDEIIDTISIAVTNINDIAGNNLVEDTILINTRIDTKEPLLTSYQLSSTLLNRSDIGNNALELELTFNKKMNVSISLESQFSFTNLIPSVLNLNSSSEWLSDTTCNIVFDLLDTSEEYFDVDIYFDSIRDLSNNSPVQDTILNAFSIDTKRPTPNTLSALNSTVYDGNVGQSGFEMELVYSEAMDVSQIPILSLVNGTNISNSITYNAFSSEWINDTLFNAKFDVFDENIEVEEIFVDINFGKDASGNFQSLSVAVDTINLDTKNPKINVFNANTYAVSNASGNFSVLLIFNEPMDQSSHPQIGFSDNQVSNALIENQTLSQWYNETTFEKVYDIENTDFNAGNVFVMLTEGYDIAGNNVIKDTMQSTISVDLELLQLSELIDSENQYNMLVYPNPANINGNITVQLPTNNNATHADIRIIDASGKTVYSGLEEKKNATYSLNLEKLKMGTYVLSVEEEGIRFNQKIIIVNE